MPLVAPLLDQLSHLWTYFGFTSLYSMLVYTFNQLMNNRHVADLIKYVFLGSIIEAGRQLSQKIIDTASRLFVFEASFETGDFAYDWVIRYLAYHKIWDDSRVYRVKVENPMNAHDSAQITANKEDELGRPIQLYMPTPQAPVFFRYKGSQWITVNMGQGNYSFQNQSYGAVITLKVWSRSRKVLDEFVADARRHYFENSVQPPRRLQTIPDASGSLITVRFLQGDKSYDWMLAWIRAHDTFESANHLEITTKPLELYRNTKSGQKELVSYKPVFGTKQRVFWKEHWFQFDVNDANAGQRQTPNTFGSPYMYGAGPALPLGTMEVTVHSSKRSLITDLVMAAREEYSQLKLSQVTVHLAGHNGWMTSMAKPKRSLDTILLPEGVKEMLIRDIVDFLNSEEWYTWGGVPHRRGYLLYGPPGTGKSSTIHAVASELGLEIYYIQLSARGMDDDRLQDLLAQAPPKCVLLLEDIDCAFQSREQAEEPTAPPYLNGFAPAFGSRRYSSSSFVTFSGLLNCLDSVISGEGRIVFATTNHLEKLDPALVRPGRMDMKIEYKLASRQQMRQTYLRLYGSSIKVPWTQSGESDSESERDKSTSATEVEEETLEQLATRFADQIPEEEYSLAQIQEYLIRKRSNAIRAACDVGEWIEEQKEEKRKMEATEKLRKEAAAAVKENEGKRGEDDTSSQTSLVDILLPPAQT